MPSQSDYDYFLRGNPDDVRLMLVEVTHPAFANAHRYVQNHSDGVTVGGAYYAYAPIGIKKSNVNDDLDQSITVTVGDLGQALTDDLDRVRADEQYLKIKPVLNYYEYLLSNLNAPALSVTGLEVTDAQFAKEGVAFVCRAKQLNLTKTGLIYSLDKFPTLRGFL